VFSVALAARDEYLTECAATFGTGQFLNAQQNYPVLQGQKANLYKCFLPQVWRFGRGVQALLHPEGPYDDPNGGSLRAEIYARLRMHFQFHNELKLFPEVDHRVKFSLNLYATPQTPSFATMANLYAPGTITESLLNRGDGITPGIKTDRATWEIAGHRNRLVNVETKTLALFASLYVRIPRDGEQCFHGIVNTDSTAT
jgi:hypothetical protein